MGINYFITHLNTSLKFTFLKRKGYLFSCLRLDGLVFAAF